MDIPMNISCIHSIMKWAKIWRLSRAWSEDPPSNFQCSNRSKFRYSTLLIFMTQGPWITLSYSDSSLPFWAKCIVANCGKENGNISYWCLLLSHICSIQQAISYSNSHFNFRNNLTLCISYRNDVTDKSGHSVYRWFTPRGSEDILWLLLSPWFHQDPFDHITLLITVPDWHV